VHGFPLIYEKGRREDGPVFSCAGEKTPLFRIGMRKICCGPIASVEENKRGERELDPIGEKKGTRRPGRSPFPQ